MNQTAASSNCRRDIACARPVADSKFKNHLNSREAMTPETQAISSNQSSPTAFPNGTSRQPSLVAATATLTTCQVPDD